MLKIGMMLSLEATDMDQVEKYKCRIADIEEGKIYIDYPINIATNKTVFLLNSLPLKVEFITQDNLAFQFKSQVIGKIKKNIPLIILYFPGVEKCKKIQRRQFVRVGSAIDISLSFSQSKSTFTTITEDISAGGCAIILPPNSKFLNNESGEAMLVLPMQSGDYHYLKISIELIRVWDKDGKKIGSIQFIDISEKEKQLLFRFCFERQLELRKKGLLT